MVGNRIIGTTTASPSATPTLILGQRTKTSGCVAVNGYEAAQPIPGFHEKDKVENYLHAQVCAGKISLQEAQLKIADNWEQFYNQ